MAYERPIRDILRGSIWLDRESGQRVIVVTAGNRYVEFMRGRDQVEIFFEAHFRVRFHAAYDRTALRSQFSMSLANLVSFHAFWHPTDNRMFARSARRDPSDAFKPSRGRGGAVPQGAIFVGTYSSPVSPDAFFDDLNDVLFAGAGRGAPAA